MTADERINALLERAGCPVMVVKSDAPPTPERHMAYLIDRLEAALENALNERDALHGELEEYIKRVIGRTGGIYACVMCKHYRSPYSEDFFKGRCPVGCAGFRHWEWRGVPDKEDT